MQFETFLFGHINVNPDTVLNFPRGLPGFEGHTRFALIHEDDGNGNTEAPTSYTLQSLDDPMVAFQIVDPAAFGFNYELEISDEETALLKVERSEDVVVMIALLRRDDAPNKIEANFRAPMIINTASRIGLQKVINRLRPNITLSNLAASTAD